MFITGIKCWTTCRREVSERAAALREKAEKCTARRRSEAVRLLDEADGRAKGSLQALLQVTVVVFQ